MARIVIKPTEFIRHARDGTTETAYGYTVYSDNHGDNSDSYSVLFASMQDVWEALKPENVRETLADQTPGFEPPYDDWDEPNETIWFEIAGEDYTLEQIRAAEGQALERGDEEK